MNVHEIFVRIRYGETDQMGVVHHGNYALYLEMGRTEWLRTFGISYNDMEKSGIMLSWEGIVILYPAEQKHL